MHTNEDGSPSSSMPLPVEVDGELRYTALELSNTAERLQSTPEDSKATAILKDCIRNHYADLLAAIRIMVLSAKLAADYHAATDSASEILNETTMRVLDKASKFDDTRLPRPWILGFARIAVIQLREKRTSDSRRLVPLDTIVGDVENSVSNEMRDRVIFDQMRLIATSQDNLPEGIIIAAETLAEEVALFEELIEAMESLSSEDQQVLRLALQLNFDTALIARNLRITPAATRARLSRALTRLQHALLQRRQAGKV